MTTCPHCNKEITEISSLELRLQKAEADRDMIKLDLEELHEHARSTAMSVGILNSQIEGDSHGVPGACDLLDMIGERANKWREVAEEFAKSCEMVRHGTPGMGDALERFNAMKEGK